MQKIPQQEVSVSGDRAGTRGGTAPVQFLKDWIHTQQGEKQVA
ncbi:hypothetical protein [uncultured Thiocystis sp.]|nr:hypothetical protein [uncultured Thiocystis sp.]